MSKKAGAVSAETKEWILHSAREEFSAHGFQHSSLRRICSSAGVTTGALYFFFTGKDDLFETILSGVTEPFLRFMQAHYAAEAEAFQQGGTEAEEEDLDVVNFLIDFYFDQQQTWDIFLKHLSHPAVRRFMDAFMDASTDHYLHLLALAERTQPRSCPVDRFALHQFVHMQTNALLVLLSHDFTWEEMLSHSKTMTKMLRGAFYALLSA